MPYEQFQGIYNAIEDRMDRLQQTINNLTPFIQPEQRPEFNPQKTG
jgi:hypothetical protein